MDPVGPMQTPILPSGSLGTVDIAPEKVKVAVDELFKTLRNTQRDGSIWGCDVFFVVICHNRAQSKSF